MKSSRRRRRRRAVGRELVLVVVVVLVARRLWEHFSDDKLPWAVKRSAGGGVMVMFLLSNMTILGYKYRSRWAATWLIESWHFVRKAGAIV